MQAFLILALLTALVAVVFAVQNTTPVTVDVFAWQVQGSLALILLVTLAVGVGIGILGSLPTLIRRSWKISSQTKRINELEKTLGKTQETLSEAKVTQSEKKSVNKEETSHSTSS